METYRTRGDETQLLLNKARVERTVVFNVNAAKEEVLAFIEGLLLGNYSFNKYKKRDKKKDNTLEQVDVYDNDITEE